MATNALSVSDISIVQVRLVEVRDTGHIIEVYQRENGILKKATTLFKTDMLTSPLLPGFTC